MDGANKAFIHGKDIWLNDHLIVYNVKNGAANPFKEPSLQTDLNIYDFDLRKIGNITDAAGHALEAYQLYLLTEVLAGSTIKKPLPRIMHRKTHAIRAYFLPWGSNDSYAGHLGNNADFFFTPTMNGCTFATEGANNPLVVHSNHANPATEQIDQGRIDQDIQGLMPGGAAATLKRNDYKPPVGGAVGYEDYKVTVVGIRKTTGWEFYYQKYKQDLGPKPGGGTHLVNTAVNRRAQIL